MKPDRLPHPQSLIAMITSLGDEQLPLELMVLKSHLIAERQMYALLAFRLDVEEQYLPPLTYFPLAKLALGGASYRDTLHQVLALNDLRNEFSHELLSGKILKCMETLSERTKVFWPTWQPAENEMLPLGADRAVRMACGLCLGDVWCHVVEVAIEQGRYPTEDTREAARQELGLFRGAQAQRRDDERSIAELCTWIKTEFAELQRSLNVS